MNERVEQALQAKAQELGITVDKLTDEEKTLALIKMPGPDGYFDLMRHDLLHKHENALYDLEVDYQYRLSEVRNRFMSEILALAGLKPTDAELMASETLEEARARYLRTSTRQERGGGA